MDWSMPGLLVHHQLLSLFKLMSIELVMPSNHLILCHPLLLPPSIFPSLRVFSKWVSSLHQVAKVYITLSPITRDKSHAWSKPIPEPICDFVCSSLLSLWVSQVVLVIKNSPANAGDTGDAGDIGLIPESERSTRVGNGTPLQYSCLESYVGRGAWQTYSPWTCKELDMMEHSAATLPTVYLLHWLSTLKWFTISFFKPEAYNQAIEYW